MEVVTMALGGLGYLSKVASLDEWKRILDGEVLYLVAKMVDIKKEISSTPVQRSKKRGRDHDLWRWIADGENLVEKVQCLLRDMGSWRCYPLSAKMRWDASGLVSDLKLLAKTGDELHETALSDAQGLCSSYHIPVKHMVGQETRKKLDELKVLLEGDKVARIAIYGMVGIGKTFVMEHLHNSALDKFDFVLWVRSPDEFTIKNVQDAIAARVHCDISSDVDLHVRALKLSQILAGLAGRGRFALFLDGVPETDLSLDDIGIPISAECKLVLSSSSAVVVGNLRSFVTVHVERLPREEAYQLFVQEVKLVPGLVSSLDEMPRKLVDTCGGIPRNIVNLVTCMSGKDDPREWSYELFQSGSLRMKNKLHVEPLQRSKRAKTLDEGQPSSSAYRPG